MRTLLCAVLLLAGCDAPDVVADASVSGFDGAVMHSGGTSGTGGTSTGGTSGSGGSDAATAKPVSDAAVLPADFAIALPAHCPCPLGSYCDLATNSCKLGCLGNDHCPPTERCDTTIYQCSPLCDDKSPCPNHRACTHPVPGGNICTACIASHDMAGFGVPSCPCVSGFSDCNGDPSDGCETPLDTLTDCGRCGRAATEQCLHDKDGDRYGVLATAVVRCGCLSGEIDSTYSMGDDCDDTDFNVHPGQMQYFTMPRMSGGYDYNCDGFVDVQFFYGVETGCSDLFCDESFWVGSAPACGAQGMRVDCIHPTNGDCTTRAPLTLQQACR